MRSGITIGITATFIVIALSLQGCGRKAPLTLPTSKARASQATVPQAPSPQTSVTQKTDEPAKPQGN